MDKEIADLEVSINYLKKSLYDDNGNLYPVETFAGGWKDRQTKMDLLNDYEKKLERLKNPDLAKTASVIRKVTNNIPAHIIEESEKKKKMIAQIPVKNTMLTGIYCCMQQPDGTWHDTYIVHSGLSQNNHKKYVSFYDASDLDVSTGYGKLKFSPIEEIDESIMKIEEENIQILNELTIDFLKNIDRKHNLESIPTIMECKNCAYKEETVEIGLPNTNEDPKYTKDTMEPPVNSKNSNSSNQNQTEYIYTPTNFKTKINFKKFLDEVKKEYPDLQAKVFEVANDDKTYTAAILSKPIEELKLKNTRYYDYFYEGVKVEDMDNITKNVYDDFTGTQLVDDITKFWINNYESSLNHLNPGLSIDFEYDENKKLYKVSSSTMPLDSLIYPIPKGTANLMDSEGYVGRTTHYVVSYEFNQDNKLEGKMHGYAKEANFVNKNHVEQYGETSKTI